jgi:hypothetical protein
MQEITNLQKVICITLDVHLWSGRAKLRETDMRMGAGGELPPGDLASLGSKKIVNPENIAKFEALKKEAERECAKVGIKFLGGFAIPEDKAKALAVTLDEIGVRFAQEKQLLLDNYDALITEWVAAHQGWESTIEGSTIDRHNVDNKLQYGWQAFRITTAGELEQPDDVLNKGLTTTAKGLAGQLYYEISQAAAKVMEISLLGRDKVTQKIRSPIRAIRGKLHGLSFIDKRVKPLVETIDHIFEQLPDSGHIEGLGLTAIFGLVYILSNEERMTKHGELILSGKPVEESFSLSVPQAKKTVEPEIEAEPQVIEASPDPVIQQQVSEPVVQQQMELVSNVQNVVVAAVEPFVAKAPDFGQAMIPAIPPVVRKPVKLFSAAA